jgi:hypothetical protein
MLKKIDIKHLEIADPCVSAAQFRAAFLSRLPPELASQVKPRHVSRAATITGLPSGTRLVTPHQAILLSVFSAAHLLPVFPSGESSPLAFLADEGAAWAGSSTADGLVKILSLLEDAAQRTGSPIYEAIASASDRLELKAVLGLMSAGSARAHISTLFPFLTKSQAETRVKMIQASFPAPTVINLETLEDGGRAAGALANSEAMLSSDASEFVRGLKSLISEVEKSTSPREFPRIRPGTTFGQVLDCLGPVLGSRPSGSGLMVALRDLAGIAPSARNLKVKEVARLVVAIRCRSNLEILLRTEALLGGVATSNKGLNPGGKADLSRLWAFLPEDWKAIQPGTTAVAV